MNKVIKATLVVFGIASISNASAITGSSSMLLTGNDTEKSKTEEIQSDNQMLQDFQTYLEQTMAPNMRPGIKNPRCSPYPQCVFSGARAQPTN